VIKALLVGGPPGLRAHLLTALEAVRPQSSWTVVGGARAGRAVAAAAEFDLVVVDLSVADADPAVLLVDLHSASPGRPIVALPAADRRSDVLCALQLGAAGVLPSDASADDAVAALRTVLEGGVAMPARLVRSAVPAASAEGGPSPVSRGAESYVRVPEPDAPSLARLGLTPRQTEVLVRLLRGQSNKSIARELHLSVETVKDHVAAVLRGLSVHSRTQAVLAVERMLRERAAPREAEPTLQSAWRAVVAGRGGASAAVLGGPDVR
jgi:DNA-binding NarL/FixJ family response regulator